MKSALISAVIFLLVTVAAGCSSAPAVRDRYENLDYDSKSVFLTYYPYLSPSERDEFLSKPDADPHEMINAWAGELDDPNHEVGSFEEMMSHRLNRKITDLRIGIGDPASPLEEPVTQGTRIALHAFVTYASRSKRVEVTRDAEWRVDSGLGRIESRDGGKVLAIGCVDSDLGVSADFLGERDSSRMIRIRKPLDALELKVSEAYIGIDSGYNFKLVLLARCKDGTVSDVSCQASWASASDAGRIEGCGNFVISSKEKLAREEALTVTARYGDLSLRKTLRPPVR